MYNPKYYERPEILDWSDNFAHHRSACSPSDWMSCAPWQCGPVWRWYKKNYSKSYCPPDDWMSCAPWQCGPAWRWHKSFSAY